MNYAQIVKHGGPGGVLLGGYLIAFINWKFRSISESNAILYGSIIALVIVVVVSLLTDHILVIIAWDEISDTHDHIRNKVGDKQFYYDHEEKREVLNNEDNKALYEVVLLTAIIIFLPISFNVLLSVFGYLGILIFLLILILALFVIRLLVLRARKIIRLSRRYYGREP